MAEWNEFENGKIDGIYISAELTANGQSDQKRNFCGSIPKSTVVGFRISQ
jgi:hypothetical protein